MDITRARPADLTRIMQMIGALSAFHGDKATITLEAAQEAFFGPHPQATALVAKEDGKLIGYAGLLWTTTLHSGQARIDIHHLFVEQSARNRGVGAALIAHASEIAQAAGAKGLTIGTDPKNMGAQAAYRAMGLEEITDAGPRFWIPVAPDQ